MRIAIVGLGVMGRNHHRVLQAMGHDVVTVDPAGHADHLSIGTVGWDRIQAVIIATPHDHLIGRVIELRGRPMLVEKPGCENEDSLERYMPEDAWIGYVERFNPVVRELAARTGEVTAVSTRRLGGLARTSVSPALDLATHDLDILGMLGLDRSVLASLSHPGNLAALLRCGTLEASHLHSVKTRTITITGTPNLHADLQQQRLWQDGTQVPVALAEPLALQDRAFLAGEPCPVSVGAATETLRIAQELERPPVLTMPPGSRSGTLLTV